MLDWIPRSLTGVILASLYSIVAITAVVLDRGPGGGGNWISLKGMNSLLITFPVSVLGEIAGMKPDFRRNLDMLFAILTCGTLLYFVGAGFGKVARMIFSGSAAA